MHITPIDHGLTLAANAPGYVRSPGLHMSDIYNALYAKLDKARYAKGGGPDVEKMELGMAFEEALEVSLRERLFKSDRPGEFTTREGVIYNPDQLFYEPDFRLGEFKCTWYKDVGLRDKRFDKWLTQMKSYCYHLGTPYARLYTFFVNGNYKPPTPRLKAWDIEFTSRELNDNWNMMLRFAEREGLL